MKVKTSPVEQEWHVTIHESMPPPPDPAEEDGEYAELASTFPWTLHLGRHVIAHGEAWSEQEAIEAADSQREAYDAGTPRNHRGHKTVALKGA